MKYALLIAWREFVESAKAKGFWLGLLMMPAMLFLSIQAPIWLEKTATPVRTFVVVDQSNEFAPAIEARLERSYQEKVLAALRDFSRNSGNAPAGLSKLSIEDFMARGGAEPWLNMITPKPGGAVFKAPRRMIQRVNLPEEVNPQTSLATIVQSLKPYLRGEKNLDKNTGHSALSAALLIPTNVFASVVRPATDPAKAEHVARGEPIQFWSANNSDPRLYKELEDAINSEIRN